MLPGLPTRPFHPRRARARTRALLPALLALLATGTAFALEVDVLATREQAGYVWTDVRLADLFAPRVAESLSRGMPATLRLHTELWRRRHGWFGRLESSFDAEVRIRYDVWSRAYQLERRGAPTSGLASLDSVEIGDVMVRDVDAMVVDNDALSTALLGMSFLGRFDMQRQGTTLILRRNR